MKNISEDLGLKLDHPIDEKPVISESLPLDEHLFTPQHEVISWTEITPTSGKRTQELLSRDPRLGKLQPIQILEYLAPNTDTGIILFPGGFDQATDNEALQMGQSRDMSVFHIKYSPDSSFSIRREVSQILDHTESRGIKRYNIIAGSWGGIPALNAIYTLLQEGNAEIESLVTVAAAFQPSDMAVMVREIGGRLASPALKIKSLSIPGRQTMARISRGIPDFQYNDPAILQSLSEISTVILVPPNGRDWWVDARKSHDKYFPNANIVEYPAFTNLIEKFRTIGGHDASAALLGIRQIENSMLDNPKATLAIPDKFNQIK